MDSYSKKKYRQIRFHNFFMFFNAGKSSHYTEIETLPPVYFDSVFF